MNRGDGYVPGVHDADYPVGVAYSARIAWIGGTRDEEGKKDGGRMKEGVRFRRTLRENSKQSGVLMITREKDQVDSYRLLSL